MKRFPLIAILAVAFIFSVVFAAEAKVYHFEINGVPFAAVEKADGTLDSFEVPVEYHAKFKGQIPQKTVARQQTPEKATIQGTIIVPVTKVSNQPKAEEVKAQVKQVSEILPVITPKATKRVFVANGKTRGEYAGDNECQKIDNWVASKAEKVEVSAPTATELTDTKSIPAPKNTGALDITKNCKAEAPQFEVYAGPKQDGQKEVSKSVPQSEVHEGSKQHGRGTILYEIKKGFVRLPQDPQDEKDLRSWTVVGNKLIKMDPATGYSMEKPIPWGYRILYDSKKGNCEVIMVKEAVIPDGYELLRKENKS